MFIAFYPTTGKCQWIACFLESFSIVFPCAFSHRITNGECHENMMFVNCFPALRKRWNKSCFPERYFIVFPSARTLHFPSIFLTELPMVNAIKTWCLSIVFLHHENASVYLVFLNVFLKFSRAREPCIFQVFSHRITNGEYNENMMFVDCFSAIRKRLCIPCFPQRFL